MSQAHWVTTWFHQDSKITEGRYANVGANSSDQYVQNVYWRCVYGFFHSSIRVNPEAKHVLFTNARNLPIVDGVCFRAALEQLGVLVVFLEYTFSPPPEYPKNWRNQFYVFDCIKWFRENAAADDIVGLFDSDIVWLKPLSKISEGMSEGSVMAYDMRYPVDKDIHGLTLNDSKELYRELGVDLGGQAPKYYGGEFFLCEFSALEGLIEAVKFGWSESMRRWSIGETFFTEEAHVLSFAYSQSERDIHDLSVYAKRIWTSFKGYNNSSESDLDLVMWHLPSEKRFGFRRYYAAVRRKPTLFDGVPQSEFVRYLSRVMNVPRMTVKNRVMNYVEHVLWKAKGIVRRGVW